MFNKLNSSLNVKTLKDKSSLSNLNSKQLFELEKSIIFGQNTLTESVSIVETIDNLEKPTESNERIGTSESYQTTEVEQPNVPGKLKGDKSYQTVSIDVKDTGITE